MVSAGFDWNPNLAIYRKQVDCHSLIDCTDTSNVKVKLKCTNAGSNNSDRVWTGNTDVNNTYVTFLKLGAT